MGKKVVVRNRKRGKEVERRVKKKFEELGFLAERVGVLGKEDVFVVGDKVFRVEVKSRKRLGVVRWWEQVQRVKRSSEEVGVVVMHEYGKKRYFVMMELEDFLKVVSKK